MQDLTDQDLVSLVVKHHDNDAFKQLVDRYQSRLRYSLRQLTGWDEALADDLVQETFLQAHKGLPSFRAQAQFYTWLYRIAYNCFLQYLRKTKAKREREMSYHTAELEIDNLAAHHEASSGLHQRVAKLLSAIEPERRIVLHLFLHQQFTHQEISDAVGIPLGSVKSHIKRGRDYLQERLQEWRLD